MNEHPVYGKPVSFQKVNIKGKEEGEIAYYIKTTYKQTYGMRRYENEEMRDFAYEELLKTLIEK